MPMKKTSCSRASVDHLHRPRDHPRHPPSFKFHGVAPTERPCAQFPRSRQSGPPSTGFGAIRNGGRPGEWDAGRVSRGTRGSWSGNQATRWRSGATRSTSRACPPISLRTGAHQMHSPNVCTPHPGARREEESEGNMALDGTQRRYRVAACPAPRGATVARRRSGHMRRGAHLEGVVLYFVGGAAE